MENSVISAQTSDLNQIFIKSLTFFPQKSIGVENDSKSITPIALPYSIVQH